MTSRHGGAARGGKLCDVKKALSAARMPSAGPGRGGGRERGAPRGCAAGARRPLLLPRRELRGWVAGCPPREGALGAPGACGSAGAPLGSRPGAAGSTRVHLRLRCSPRCSVLLSSRGMGEDGGPLLSQLPSPSSLPEAARIKAKAAVVRSPFPCPLGSVFSASP